MIESLSELTAGDTVAVRGNGLAVTSTVEVIEYDSWKGKQTARLAPTDGITVSLTESSGPFHDDGLRTHVGSVRVRRV